MRVIEGQSVDLIEPFPISEAKRVFGWMRCYKSVIETDISPKTPEEYQEFMAALPEIVRTFGVIDRDNRLGIRHEAPLIGMVAFEPATIYNGYLHVASTRKAWGSRLIDEAVEQTIDELFDSMPELLRLSAMLLHNNYPARGLARRLGFVRDGVFEDFVSQNGDPRTVVHMGLTRRKWNELHEESSQTAVTSGS